MSELIIISVIITFCLQVSNIKCQENYLLKEQSNMTLELFNLSNSSSNTNINNTILFAMEPIVELYTFPFIVLMATVCNILTFLVMRRKNMRRHSTCFYMAVLAIADELVILVGCLNYWIYLFFKESIMFTKMGCKILCSALYGTLHFSVWIVVVMTIERYIAVALPLQANQYCTVNRAKVACMILALFVFTINFHFLITHSLVNGECIPSTYLYEKFMESYWPWIDGIIYSYVPLTLLIIFNILIVHNLIKASENIQKLQNQTNISNSMSNNSIRQCNTAIKPSNYVAKEKVKYLKAQRYWCLILPFFCWFKKTKKQDLVENDPLNGNQSLNKQNSLNVTSTITSIRKHNVKIKNTVSNHSNINLNGSVLNHTTVNNSTAQQTPSNSPNRRLTIMLLVVSITFCLTSVPIVTLQTIERYLKTNILSSNNQLVILKGIFLALQYLNHSVNFFLYAVTGKTFRREFFALFGNRKAKHRFNENLNPNNRSKMITNLNQNNKKIKIAKNLNNSTITEYSSYDGNRVNPRNIVKCDYKYDIKANKLIHLEDKKQLNEAKNTLETRESSSNTISASVASLFRTNNNNNLNEV